MVDSFPNQKSGLLRFLFLATSVICLIAAVLFAYRNFGGFGSETKIVSAKKITFLIHLQSDSDEMIFSVFFELYPKEKKAALFFINPLIAFENETESLLEKKGDAVGVLEKQLKDTLGVSPTYTVSVSETGFRKIIDLFGGIEIFLDPKSPSETLGYKRMKVLYTLDGEDAYDYISFLPDQKTLSYVQRMDRQESLFLTFLESFHEKRETISKANILYLQTLVKSSIPSKDWETLFDFLKKERIHFGISELPGEPILRTKSKDEYLKARQETVKVAFQKFSSELRSVYFSDGDRARIEVLNGTAKNGLAKYGKSLLNEKRLKVLSVGNAWGSDFSKTMILDRSGNTFYADMISETFQGRKVYHVLRKDLGLDASVILGEDFQGNRP